MSLSFVILCAQTDAPWPALETLAEAARPGDEVILADTGMQGQGAAAFEAFARDPGFAEGVAFEALRIEGGQGGGALAMALARAGGAHVLFADAATRFEPGALDAARDLLAREAPDLLVAPFPASEGPAPDAALWHRIEAQDAPDDLRPWAAAAAPAPARLIWRRGFAQAAAIRPPEGKGAAEALHWELCLRADRLIPCHRPLAHRIAPPPPPGAAAALFAHHARLRADGLAATPALLTALARHWGDLEATGMWESARHLAGLVQDPQAAEEIEAAGTVLDHVAGGPALLARIGMLRRLDPASAAQLWQGEAVARRLDALSTRVAALEEEARAHRAIAERAALRALKPPE